MSLFLKVAAVSIMTPVFVQDLTGSLHTRLRLQDDDLLQALKASPITASHAEARTRELMEELIAADHRSAAQRTADQLAQRSVAQNIACRTVQLWL